MSASVLAPLLASTASSVPMLFAWVPFLNPVKLPVGGRLWMALPLILCVALVYRATRARDVRDLPKATALTFINIVVGMIAIAAAFYIVNRAALWLT